MLDHQEGMLIVGYQARLTYSLIKALVELKASQNGNHIWQTPFVVFLGAGSARRSAGPARKSGH